MSTIKCVIATVTHACGHARTYTIPQAFLNSITTDKAAHVCPTCQDEQYYKRGLIRHDKLFA